MADRSSALADGKPQESGREPARERRSRATVGVILVDGKPARAALYHPLLRRAVGVEWETAFVRLAGAEGESTLCVVSREGACSNGGGSSSVPAAAARTLSLEPHLALFFAGLHDGIIDMQAHGAFAFVEWDIHGLDVCIVAAGGGAARLLAQVRQPDLRTSELSREVGLRVLIPGALRGTSSGVVGGLGEREQAIIAEAGGRLLRRCWLTPRESFACAIPPMASVSALARSATVSIGRDQILGQCRLALSDVIGQVHVALEDAGVPDNAPVRVVVSGEVAQWQELLAALASIRGPEAVVVPPQPEYFAARGAAVAAAREAGVLARPSGRRGHAGG